MHCCHCGAHCKHGASLHIVMAVVVLIMDIISVLSLIVVAVVLIISIVDIVGMLYVIILSASSGQRQGQIMQGL